VNDNLLNLVELMNAIQASRVLACGTCLTPIGSKAPGSRGKMNAPKTCGKVWSILVAQSTCQ